jgi:2-methylcitrate dehydratase
LAATRDLAEAALAVSFDRLPPEAVERAKRVIVDTFACLIGGYRSPTGRICREVARELGGPRRATIIGEGRRVGLSGAILANEGMIRYLDYNDDMSIAIGPGDLAAAHPSGALPVAFAVGEWQGLSGRRVIEAVVAGYEVIGRLLSSYATSLEVRGFHHGSTLVYAGAAIAGKLLGLSAAEIAEAMGIAGSLTVGLDILDADGEEYVMTKNVADGLFAERGLLGALLARRGFTGPERVIEGNKGFADAVLGGRERFRPKPSGNRPYVLATMFKSVCAEATTHGHLKATCDLVATHGLKPEDIAGIRIRTGKRAVVHTGDPMKKHPRNKETADHSSYFLTAMAVLEGRITPRVYDERNFTDPRVAALIDKVTLEHGPEFDARPPAAETIILTRDGRELRRRVEPEELKGDPANPMTDDDLREKFLLCADGLLPRRRVDRIIEACLALDRRERFADVLPLLKVRA